MVNKTQKSVEFSLRTIKICRFEIIDGVKYVYCIKHAYKFVLREQEWFAAVLWRLRQKSVSCMYMIRTCTCIINLKKKRIFWLTVEYINGTHSSNISVFSKVHVYLSLCIYSYDEHVGVALMYRHHLLTFALYEI